MFCFDLFASAVQFPAHLRRRAPGTALAAIRKFAFTPFLVLGVCSIATSGFSQNFRLNTVSYSLEGTLSGGITESAPSGFTHFSGSDFAQSIDPVTLIDSVFATHGTGGAESVASVIVSASAEPGKLRAVLSGKLSRRSNDAGPAKGGIGDASLRNARVQARCQDSYVIGNSINPVPNRLEHIQATLIVNGEFDINLMQSPVSNDSRFAAATVQLTLDAQNSQNSLVDPLPPPPYSGRYFGEAAESTLQTVGFNRPPERLIPVNFFARQGHPATMDLLMEVSASARATVAYRLNVDNFFAVDFTGKFGNTLRWGGITSVTDAATGEPIEGWTITSASGFDYAHAAPVPEPTTVCLALLGLLGLARRRIRV